MGKLSRVSRRVKTRSSFQRGLLVWLVLWACLAIASVGLAADEFRICSDNTSAGAGEPCQSSTCLVAVGHTVAGVVGGACAENGPATAQIQYEFNTSSTSGTAFVIWQRIIADGSWDVGEQYDCFLSGVTDLGTVAFSITEAELDASELNPGCGALTSTEKVCWATDTVVSSVALDQGIHTLSCLITMNHASEFGGFDGFIFTSDLAYVPDEQDTACNDDATFAAGTCFGNWGPNQFPGPSVSSVPTLAPAALAVLAGALAVLGWAMSRVRRLPQAPGE